MTMTHESGTYDPKFLLITPRKIDTTINHDELKISAISHFKFLDMHFRLARAQHNSRNNDIMSLTKCGTPSLL